MNLVEPKILLLYNREFEAQSIETYLKSRHIHNLTGTDHIMTGVKYCNGGNVDVIISNLYLYNQDIADKLLSKKALLGIPIIFYTNDLSLYQSFQSSKIFKENKHIDILLNPTNGETLFKLINKLYKLKLENKTKDYVLAKKYIGSTEKVYFEEITYVESAISHCILHTKWGNYKISGNLTKLMRELGPNFIKIHEKYVVNSKKVSELTRHELKIENLRIPIGSRYSIQVKAKLNNKIIQKELRIAG